jgi:hypothetical protein
MISPCPVYLFRSGGFAPSGNTVVSVAPLDCVVAAYGGGGIVGEGGLKAVFGGAVVYKMRSLGNASSGSGALATPHVFAVSFVLTCTSCFTRKSQKLAVYFGEPNESDRNGPRACRGCTAIRLDETKLVTRFPQRVDSVEKVLCGAHAHFLKAADALDAVGCGGPVQSTQDRSAISLVLRRRPLLPKFAPS